MLRKDAKTKLISRAPLFSHCSKRQLQQVASIADEIDVKEGKTLTREGGPGREFFVIIEGTADVIQGSTRINRLKTGDFFGEIALIRKLPRTATVKATSPLRALVLTNQNFARLLKTSPGIEQQVLNALAERFS